MAQCYIARLHWLESRLCAEVVVILLAVICYANSFRGDFVHDDIFAIKDNQDLRPETPLRALLANDFWGTPMSSPTSHKSYRPLCVLTFRLNYLAAGLSASHYHVTNVVLHALASLLLFVAADEVVFRRRSLAALAAMLFAVQPVHTEAVSGIVGRADVLACILSLLSFLSYYRCARHAGTTSWPLLCISVLCAAAAMLCKEQGITVLGICFIYDWLVNQSFLQTRQISVSAVMLNRHLLIRSATLLISTACLLAFRLHMLNGQLPGFTDQDNPASFAPQWSTRFFTFAYLWAFNGNLLTTPVVLSYDWQMGSIPLVESVLDPRQAATVVTFAILAALSFRALLHSSIYVRRVLLVSLSFLVLPFLPASNLFFRVGFVVAERILYMPSIGFSLLVVFGLNQLARSCCGATSSAPVQPPKASVSKLPSGPPASQPSVATSSLALALAFAGLLALMAGKTVLRNPVWWTRESLFQSGLEVVPNNAKVHYNYANFLKDSERASEAVGHYRTALDLYPNHPSACNNLGTVVQDKKEAEKLYVRATELNPRHVNAYFNLASLLKDQGRLQESEETFRKALAIDEKYGEALSGLSSVLEAQGKADLALSTLQHAISLHPSNADYHHNLAVHYGRYDQMQKSLSSYEEALRLKPGRHITLVNYARQLRLARRNGDAEKTFRLALKVRRDADTLHAYGTMLHNLERTKEAEELYQEALKLEPEHYNSSVNLAVLRVRQEKLGEAHRLLMKCISKRPEELSAYTQLMSVYSTAGKHKNVVAVFDEALAHSVPGAETYDLHASSLHALERTDEALKSWNEAVRLNPSFSRAHMNLGACFHLQGNYPKARHHYEESLKLDPGSKLIEDNLVKLARLEKKAAQS